MNRIGQIGAWGNELKCTEIFLLKNVKYRIFFKFIPQGLILNLKNTKY